MNDKQQKENSIKTAINIKACENTLTFTGTDGKEENEFPSLSPIGEV